MRRGLGLVLGLVATCSGEPTPTRSECEDVCTIAARCGFLPSSLGGRAGDAMAALADLCTLRCMGTSNPAGQTPGQAPLEALMTCLRMGPTDTCDTRKCIDVATCVQASPLIEDEVLGRADVRVRLLDGVYWSAIFSDVCEISEGTLKADLDDNYGLDAYCSYVRDGEAESSYDCAANPEQPALCGPVDCELRDGCDPAMCSRSFVTAEADCRYYGIASVQLGYRDGSGALRLSPRELTCDEASAGEVFHDVPYGVVLPVALFHGKLSAAAASDLALDPVTEAGGDFCWTSAPGRPWRLTRSGETTAVVPTPSNVQLLDAALARAEFPVGCGCAFETIDCEALPEECVNGIDDDEDGLIDDQDPGCT